MRLVKVPLLANEREWHAVHADPVQGTTSYNWTWDNVSTGHNVWQSTVPQTFGSNGYACYNPNGRTWLLELNLYEVTYANLFYAGAQVNIGVGGV